MVKKTRIAKLANWKYQPILDQLIKHQNGELRIYLDQFRLLDEKYNPICNIKSVYINDLIEHDYLFIKKCKISILKNKI